MRVKDLETSIDLYASACLHGEWTRHSSSELLSLRSCVMVAVRTNKSYMPVTQKMLKLAEASLDNTQKSKSLIDDFIEMSTNNHFQIENAELRIQLQSFLKTKAKKKNKHLVRKLAQVSREFGKLQERLAADLS
jgi:regulator of replication initiation timing